MQSESFGEAQETCVGKLKKLDVSITVFASCPGTDVSVKGTAILVGLLDGFLSSKPNNSQGRGVTNDAKVKILASHRGKCHKRECSAKIGASLKGNKVHLMARSRGWGFRA